MNNCVGAGNLKHFLLFLIYTWACSVFSLVLLGYNYFFCADDTCVFNLVLTQLVRIMTILSVGAFLFTSSMLMNVVYGIMTGVGTIDRLKKKATGTVSDADEEPIPLTDIFGIGPLYQWPLPMDPLFDDYDRLMGYATPQRLLREQMRGTTGGQQQQHGKMMGGPTVASSVVGMASSVVTRDSYMPV
jgi:palmitoyltransferase ZDHHC3/7/25